MKALPLILLSFAAGAMQAALAHTELSETVPADGAVVAAAPENLELRFSEAVRLTALSIRKDGAAEQSLAPLPAETTAKFSVAVPALEDGRYIVAWRALSADTHVMSGELAFTVGAAGGNDAQKDDAAAPAAER